MPPSVEHSIPGTVPEDAIADDVVPITVTRSSMDAGSNRNRERSDSVVDVYAPAEKYYGDNNKAHKPKRTFTFSAIDLQSTNKMHRGSMETFPTRRSSVDESSLLPKKFLINVDSTLEELLHQEDSDQNFQITIEDLGPKTKTLGTESSGGYKTQDVRGTYMLSNLLQELKLAQMSGRRQIVLDEGRLNENPVNRLARLIKDMFWPNLTRRLDAGMIEQAGRDPKDWTDDPRPRIYIPIGAPEQHEYYTQVAMEHPEIRLDVCWLPEDITPESVRDMNSKPGILALAMEKVQDKDGKETLQGVPFIVPGGRFNELYGWDSYMESLGLLTSGRADLAKGMVENFIFCIQHYGKILNANRSYYLCRSQPPFLTDMTMRIYDHIQKEEGSRNFLRRGMLAAIKEYHTVWMAAPRYDLVTGLSRYRPDGRGVPPETESTHFTHILEPFYTALDITFEQFVEGYNNGTIKEPKLDLYFMHDRAVRESGHDTSYRLEAIAADLATIDLNSLLFKYESDLARVIRVHFNDRLEMPEEFQWKGMKESEKVFTSSYFDKQMRKRRKAVNKYCWNEETHMYYDYNTNTQEQMDYESGTTFWAMWAGIATPKQAEQLVRAAIPKLEAPGGLLAGTKASRGEVGIDRPNRQWDYPYGWAPQQMLAWTGLHRYGYIEVAERLAYKWLHMVTKAFFDYNGVVVEKYDVTRPIDPHRVDAEYGNQGLDFKGVATEGFGWVNASYVYGLGYMNTGMRRALGCLTPYHTYTRMTEHGFDDFTYDGTHQPEESGPRPSNTFPLTKKAIGNSAEHITQQSPEQSPRATAATADEIGAIKHEAAEEAIKKITEKTAGATIEETNSTTSN